MITRSVPARDAEGMFAIITTDLAVTLPPSNISLCGRRLSISSHSLPRTIWA